jgi:uncharacterized OB-fold protein
LVQAVEVRGLRAEIQLALQQAQAAQENHPSLWEQLSLVAVVDHFVLEAMPLEPAAQEEPAVVALAHLLDPQNQMQQVVRNPEPQIPVAAVALVFTKVPRPTVKVHKAALESWSFDG